MKSIETIFEKKVFKLGFRYILCGWDIYKVVAFEKNTPIIQSEITGVRIRGIVEKNPISNLRIVKCKDFPPFFYFIMLCDCFPKKKKVNKEEILHKLVKNQPRLPQ